MIFLLHSSRITCNAFTICFLTALTLIFNSSATFLIFFALNITFLLNMPGM